MYNNYGHNEHSVSQVRVSSVNNGSLKVRFRAKKWQKKVIVSIPAKKLCKLCIYCYITEIVQSF